MKIGIISLFYENDNYGGNLQAYALTKFLNENGFEAEQILYSVCEKYSIIESKRDRIIRIIKEGVIKKVAKKISLRIKLIIHKKDLENYQHQKKKRLDAISSFQIYKVKHSSEVYNSKTLVKTNNIYDIFITGSDQVWNLTFYNPNRFLSFVDNTHIKASYAASMAMSSINKNNLKILNTHLSDYKFISVREEKTCSILNRNGIKSVVTCDPVLLLSQKQWDEVASDRIISGKYIFCYLLGKNKKSRALAKEYARLKGLRIVVIPMANDGFRFLDDEFGDIVLNECTPEDFISLIKYAECLFTDSFHAMIFARIYKKLFFVFKRDRRGSMSTRIDSLIELFSCEYLYINERKKETMEYLNNIHLSNTENTKEDDFIKKSVDYLLNFLNKCN